MGPTIPEIQPKKCLTLKNTSKIFKENSAPQKLQTKFLQVFVVVDVADAAEVVAEVNYKSGLNAEIPSAA